MQAGQDISADMLIRIDEQVLPAARARECEGKSGAVSGETCHAGPDVVRLTAGFSRVERGHGGRRDAVTAGRSFLGAGAGGLHETAALDTRIINAPTLQPRLLVAFAEAQSGAAPPLSRASHEGVGLHSVISAAQQGPLTPAVSKRASPGAVRVGGTLILQLAAASSAPESTAQSKEAQHAAAGESPDRQIAGSHQTTDLSAEDAHGGHFGCSGKDWAAGRGASAWMLPALYEFGNRVHAEASSGGESAAEAAVAQPGSAPRSNVAEVVRSNRTSVSCLEFNPTSADNKRCGAGDFFASGSEQELADDGGKTPRSGATGIQHSENDATDTQPKLGNRVKAEVVTGGESAAQSGPNSFDTEQGTGTIAPAVSVRREQLANVQLRTITRYPRSASPAERGVGAQGTRVTHLRDHTSVATVLRRADAEKQTVVEAPTPRRQGPSIALNSTTRVSEILSCSFVDPGAIPGGSTPQIGKASTAVRVSEQHTGKAAADTAAFPVVGVRLEAA